MAEVLRPHRPCRDVTRRVHARHVLPQSTGIPDGLDKHHPADWHRPATRLSIHSCHTNDEIYPFYFLPPLCHILYEISPWWWSTADCTYNCDCEVVLVP